MEGLGLFWRLQDRARAFCEGDEGQLGFRGCWRQAGELRV